MPFAALTQELEMLRVQGLQRTRLVVAGPQGRELVIGGRSLLAFCSNDYLGLANDPRLIEAAVAGLRTFGVGAAASHLITGHSAAHHRVEEQLAAFVGMPRALLYSTGYMANMGVVPALAGAEDAVFSDALNHASLIDGIRLSRAAIVRYPHLDTDFLARALAQSRARRRLVVTDAVFSMDGDIAPLQELVALCERFDAWLLVDDAHGFGVLGPQGRGTLAHLGLDSPRIIYVGTLGKAAGVCGAFVAGAAAVVDTLIQRSRTYIFTTGMPPALAAAIEASLAIIAGEDWRRERLGQLITRLRERLSQAKVCLAPSQTPIQPLIIGDNAAALAASRALRDQGLLVLAIRPPTVPEGTARLRITLSAAHTLEDADRLAAGLRKALATPERSTPASAFP